MGVKLVAGLFLIGLGLGPPIHQLLPEPIKSIPVAWILFIIIGVILIILGHRE